MRSGAWGERVDKSVKFAATALWDLGLDLLGLYQGLDSLGIVTVHLLQALLCASWRSACSLGPWGLPL